MAVRTREARQSIMAQRRLMTPVRQTGAGRSSQVSRRCEALANRSRCERETKACASPDVIDGWKQKGKLSWALRRWRRRTHEQAHFRRHQAGEIRGAEERQPLRLPALRRSEEH